MCVHYSSYSSSSPLSLSQCSSSSSQLIIIIITAQASCTTITTTTSMIPATIAPQPLSGAPSWSNSLSILIKKRGGERVAAEAAEAAGVYCCHRASITGLKSVTLHGCRAVLIEAVNEQQGFQCCDLVPLCLLVPPFTVPKISLHRSRLNLDIFLLKPNGRPNGDFFAPQIIYFYGL